MKTAAAFLLSLALLPAQPQESPKAYLEKMGHGEGNLQPGELAPDFTLSKAKSADTISLSSFRGKKPVALLFGSYT